MDSPVEASESEPIDPELVAESTEPQFAPPSRPTPVAPPAVPAQGQAVPGAPGERSRRPTLASPIPALMAASMRLQGPDADGNSGASLAADGVPMMAEPQMTSKLGDHTRAVLLQGEADYVVEIDDTKTDLEPSGAAGAVASDDGDASGGR